MEINQLRYFSAAAREKSFAKAAEKCFTTRQNVSRSIKDLEAELHARLFERKGNAMVLTPAGELVSQQVSSILETIEGMRLICGEQSESHPHVRMAISHNVLSGIPAAASAIVESSVVADQIMELSSKECYERVCEKVCDVAIVTNMAREFPCCRSQIVGNSPSYLLVGESSKLAKNTHFSLADLKDIRFVLMPDARFQYKPLFDLLDPFGFDDSRVSSVTSTASMLHIIKHIEAGALVTDTYGVNPPRGTVAIPVNEPRLNWHTYVLYTMNPENYLAINQLIRALKESVQ